MKTKEKKIEKKKYWYAIDIYTCVLCGRKEIFKGRVYIERHKITQRIDDACPEHFI